MLRRLWFVYQSLDIKKVKNDRNQSGRICSKAYSKNNKRMCENNGKN